ncbi:hypothetical protein QJS66_00235 [Kocuria rhizophila]|nr:hypothetical protein QJS66_00235 [Kocuria rhizophila]
MNGVHDGVRRSGRGRGFLGFLPWNLGRGAVFLGDVDRTSWGSGRGHRDQRIPLRRVREIPVPRC